MRPGAAWRAAAGVCCRQGGAAGGPIIPVSPGTQRLQRRGGGQAAGGGGLRRGRPPAVQRGHYGGLCPSGGHAGGPVCRPGIPNGSHGQRGHTGEARRRHMGRIHSFPAFYARLNLLRSPGPYGGDHSVPGDEHCGFCGAPEFFRPAGRLKAGTGPQPRGLCADQYVGGIPARGGGGPGGGGGGGVAGTGPPERIHPGCGGKSAR